MPETATSPPETATAGNIPSRRWRVVLSLLVIGHLWAVVARPIEFATQGPFGTSPAATALRTPVRSYGEWMYLDHGYAFFAPDPGPSHLIRATVQTADGPPQQLIYPDLSDQWPRLLYHRHFMLSEFFNNLYHPAGDPPPDMAADPMAVQGWHSSRRRYEAVRDSIIHRLSLRFPDSEITIERLEHRQPGLPEFLDGSWTIDDPRLISVLPDGPGDLGDTAEPFAPAGQQSVRPARQPLRPAAEMIPPSRAVSREVAP